VPYLPTLQKASSRNLQIPRLSSIVKHYSYIGSKFRIITLMVLKEGKLDLKYGYKLDREFHGGVLLNL
jgi:hypothetical protein